MSDPIDPIGAPRPPEIPERWKRDTLKEGLARLGSKELADRASEGWTIPLPGDPTPGARGGWKARHYRFGGNVLVAIHPGAERAEEATREEYEALMEVLVERSLVRLPLSRYAVLLLSETPPADLFRALLEALDPRRVSFLVFDVTESRGWAWDARDGRVTDIVQARAKR
jgi:hypothetical protein